MPRSTPAPAPTRPTSPAFVRAAVKLGTARVGRRPGDRTGLQVYSTGIAETAVLGSSSSLRPVLPVTFLPGIWTRAQTIEGIAGRGRNRSGRRVVFLIVDVALLPALRALHQPLARHRRRQQLVVPPGLVDGRNLPALARRLDPGEPDGTRRSAESRRRRGLRSLPSPRSAAVGCGVLLHVPGRGLESRHLRGRVPAGPRARDARLGARSSPEVGVDALARHPRPNRRLAAHATGGVGSFALGCLDCCSGRRRPSATRAHAIYAALRRPVVTGTLAVPCGCSCCGGRPGSGNRCTLPREGLPQLEEPGRNPATPAETPGPGA